MSAIRAAEIRARDSGHDLPKGIALIVTAFLCSAVMGAVIKLLHQVSPLLMVFVQYAVAFLCFLPSGIRMGAHELRTKRPGLQIFRSVAGSACQLLFFMSLRSLPLLDSSLLSNAAPLFIPIVVWVWFRKGITLRVAGSLVIGVAGVLLIIHPGPQLIQDPAALLALASGILSAVTLVATNKLAETDPPAVTLLYNFGVSALLLVPAGVFTWKPYCSRAWIMLVAIGVLFAMTQWFIIAAYRYASATELSPFNYSVVVFSGVLGWVIFGNAPNAAAAMGTLLICAGGILSIMHGHAEGRGSWFGFGHWHWYWKTAQADANRAF